MAMLRDFSNPCWGFAICSRCSHRTVGRDNYHFKTILTSGSNNSRMEMQPLWSRIIEPKCVPPPIPPSVANFASRREERLFGAELCTKAPEDIQAKAKAEIEGKG